jgi:phenylacetate-coenzyme A ligase PaaK-like adenylate-forming protein
MLPRGEMEKLQVERLRAGIDRMSKTVPFYKKKLSVAGIAADSIRSLGGSGSIAIYYQAGPA